MQEGKMAGITDLQALASHGLDSGRAQRNDHRRADPHLGVEPDTACRAFG
jgi:hypothetical protein